MIDELMAIEAVSNFLHPLHSCFDVKFSLRKAFTLNGEISAAEELASCFETI